MISNSELAKELGTTKEMLYSLAHRSKIKGTVISRKLYFNESEKTDLVKRYKKLKECPDVFYLIDDMCSLFKKSKTRIYWAMRKLGLFGKAKKIFFGQSLRFVFSIEDFNKAIEELKKYYITNGGKFIVKEFGSGPKKATYSKGKGINGKGKYRIFIKDGKKEFAEIWNIEICVDFEYYFEYWQKHKYGTKCEFVS